MNPQNRAGKRGGEKGGSGHGRHQEFYQDRGYFPKEAYCSPAHSWQQRDTLGFLMPDSEAKARPQQGSGRSWTRISTGVPMAGKEVTCSWMGWKAPVAPWSSAWHSTYWVVLAAPHFLTAPHALSDEEQGLFVGALQGLAWHLRGTPGMMGG